MTTIFDLFRENDAREFEERVVKEVLGHLKRGKFKYHVLAVNRRLYDEKWLTLDTLFSNFGTWFQGDTPVRLVALRRFFFGQHTVQKIFNGTVPTGLLNGLQSLPPSDKPQALVFPLNHFRRGALCCYFGPPPPGPLTATMVLLPTADGPVVIEPLSGFLRRFKWPAARPEADRIVCKRFHDDES